jgi:penicillin-binding protein 1A
VVQYGTGRAAALGQFAAGKTGTTENFGDAWFVGWDSKYTVAVWVGYPNKLIPMTSDFDGGPVLGGTYPALIWHDFMTSALQIDKTRGEQAAAAKAKKEGKEGKEGKTSTSSTTGTSESSSPPTSSATPAQAPGQQPAGTGKANGSPSTPGAGNAGNEPAGAPQGAATPERTPVAPSTPAPAQEAPATPSAPASSAPQAPSSSSPAPSSSPQTGGVGPGG